MKLKERIKSFSGNLKEEKIKNELEEIETINIELDHRLTKLVTENEHLKHTYKKLYDSIKSSCVRSKEQCDDLIKQVNIKYVVLTSRVIVPTSRYIVPTGRVIVATGRTGRDHDGRVIILPPTTADEHIAVQRESKARTTLLQSIPDDRMRKSMLKQKYSEFKIGDAGEFALMGVTSEVPNDFVSCDDSDKSSEVNTNDFASSDSSVKSLEHKPTDSNSCASTSSVSTSMNEAEIESNDGTPIKEPIIVQDLPSFTCNSFDKNEHTSRTSCNKNGYFNKKAGHFRKNASSVSKLCFVCGSGTHLIKDCDFYDKQMANKTVGIGVGPAYNRNKVNHQNQFVPQAVFLRTGKVNILPARPQPVPTGKTKVFAPVLTDRGYSPSVSSGWWKSIARPMPHFSSPTRSYFHTYTPYVPTMSYHHMKNGRDIWATTIKPSAGTKELACPEQTAPVPTGRYVVPTGRVIVPTGRYIVPTGRVIVATGEYVVPAGKCYS
nr:ribonuclease H-like domain, reverse transcriptase, RNA-dependent DNA polymerase [Tanacetum cinerariifolium]